MSDKTKKLTAEQQKQLDSLQASLQTVTSTKPLSDDAGRLIAAANAMMGWVA